MCHSVKKVSFVLIFKIIPETTDIHKNEYSTHNKMATCQLFTNVRIICKVMCLNRYLIRYTIIFGSFGILPNEPM